MPDQDPQVVSMRKFFAYVKALERASERVITTAYSSDKDPDNLDNAVFDLNAILRSVKHPTSLKSEK